ncbi:MAG: CDP-alcohol phosphatidyltransferase family protein [Woeseia sp.]
MSLRWLPNALSLLRIVLVGPILWLIIGGHYPAALLLFLFAGVTDVVDGYLAKQFDWRTWLGALLDPIADKLLIAGLFVTLVYTGDIPFWLAAAVIIRDAVIVAGATLYHFLIGPVEGAPTRLSKLNTALELLFVLLILSQASFDWPPLATITIVGAGVLVTVVLSGMDYVWSWSRRARDAAKGSA